MYSMDRLELIKRNTQEIISEAELRDLLKKKKKPSLYIGYAPTGRIHIGYLFPISKIVDFQKAGLEVTVLTADLHAYLDDMKSSWDKLKWRSEYYTKIIKATVKALGGDPNKIKFVLGSTFQLKKEYFLPVLQMAVETTLARCKRAAAEVVRFGNEPKLGGFMYPLFQTQDIVGLNADIAFGGIDQRGIYMLSREVLPQFGRKKPICIFTPLLPGLTGGKMSASIPESKIDLLDEEAILKKKVGKAFCPAKQVEGNGVLAFFQAVIFPVLERKNKTLIIKRPEKFGGNLEFKTYNELENAYKKGLHPMDLKGAFSEFLIETLNPIRKDFSKQKVLLKKAYS
jgi:tyrosyl-tRNA synthetase